jgi:hypothetical protein
MNENPKKTYFLITHQNEAVFVRISGRVSFVAWCWQVLVLCTGAGVPEPEFWPICRSRSLFSSGKTPAALIFWILCCKLLSDIGKRPTKFDKCPTNKYSEQHTTIIEKKVKTRM